MNKFTEILLNDKYTERMVEDLNSSNLDLKDIETKKISIAKENITKIIASLDDLSKSLSEEIDTRGRNKEKEVVSNYFNNITSEPLKRKESNNRLILEEVKKEEARKEEIQNAIKRERNKEENKIKVPEKIRKAIEIANKYKVGVPFVENGDIAKMIENGKTSVEEAMIPIMNMYLYLIETNTASKEDRDYIIKTVNKELNIEDILKSLISKALVNKLT